MCIPVVRATHKYWKMRRLFGYRWVQSRAFTWITLAARRQVESEGLNVPFGRLAEELPASLIVQVVLSIVYIAVVICLWPLGSEHLSTGPSGSSRLPDHDRFYVALLGLWWKWSRHTCMGGPSCEAPTASRRQQQRLGRSGRRQRARKNGKKSTLQFAFMQYHPVLHLFSLRMNRPSACHMVFFCSCWRLFLCLIARSSTW
jgi:hypothetical protein